MPRQNTVTRDRDRDESRRAATLRLLNNPDQWNNLVLPMFKRTADGRGKQLAVVVPPIVCPTFRLYPNVNIWKLNIDWTRTDYAEYHTADQIIADGWLVD